MTVLPDTRGRDIHVLGRDPVTGLHLCQVTCFACPRTSIVSVDLEGGDFAFWACDECEKYMPADGVVPMDLFAEKVKQAQLEEEGRILTPEETLVRLDDPSSYLSLLARERPGRVV